MYRSVSLYVSLSILKAQLFFGENVMVYRMMKRVETITLLLDLGGPGEGRVTVSASAIHFS